MGPTLPLNERLAILLRNSASAPITSLPRYEAARSAFLRFAFHAEFDGAGAWERHAPLPIPLPIGGTLFISESKRNDILDWADLIEGSDNLKKTGTVVDMATC